MAVTTAFHYTFQITEFLLLNADSGPRFSNLFTTLKDAKILEKVSRSSLVLSRNPKENCLR